MPDEPAAFRSPSSGVPSLAERVVEERIGPARLLMLPAPVRDVVTFRGSVWTAPDLAAGDDFAQGLVVDLLDKGTRRRDRFAIAEDLEGRGAQLSFYNDGLRVGFAGRALTPDLPDVLALLAEQLREPLLDADEFEKERMQAVASVRRAMDSTSGQATGLLVRRLYGPAHPNFVPEPADELARLEALTVEEIRAYHVAHLASDRLTVALAGDLDPSVVAEAARAHFGDWAAHGLEPRFDADAAAAPPGRSGQWIADRPNLDVRMGHPVALRRADDDWLPVHAGLFALGGNFSARLMQTVRDERGLTYGIGSSLHNVAVEHGGHWLIHITLSGDALEEGIAATQDVARRFVDEGVRPDELTAVQATLAGQHVVSLATTGGLAARLLVTAERGFDLDYLDRYPDLVRALTAAEVNDAIRCHLDPERLHVTVAGAVPGNARSEG